MQDLFENFVFDVKIRLWLILRRLVPWFIIIVSLYIIIINIIYDSFDVYIYYLASSSKLNTYLINALGKTILLLDLFTFSFLLCFCWILLKSTLNCYKEKLLIKLQKLVPTQPWARGVPARNYWRTPSSG